MVEILCVASLGSFQIFGKRGGAIYFETPSSWCWRRCGTPARRNMGRIEAC